MKEYCKRLKLTKNILKNIYKLGAKKEFSGNVLSTYYDFKDKKLKKKNMLLRVRKKGKINELTLKQKTKKEVKNGILITTLKKEIKVNLDNLKSFNNILKELGLKKIREERFHREEYFWKGVWFEIKDKKELEIESNSLRKLKKGEIKLKRK